MNENEARENLEVIRKMIEETKKEVAYSGEIYIAWGVLTLFAVLVEYVLVLLQLFHYIILNWLGLVVLGIAYSAYHMATQTRKAKVTSFSDRAMRYTWFGCGVTLMILGFVGPLAGVYSGQVVSAVIAVVIGSAYFITGQLYQWKLLTWCSLLWWVGGGGMMFLRSETTLLVFAFLIVVGYLIPGFILRASYKKRSRE